MRIPSLPTFRLPDSLTERLFRSFQQIVDAVRKIEILDGRLIEGESLTTGNNEITHKLGRKWRGAIVVRSSLAATLRVDDSNLDDEKYFRINASAATVVSVWVF